MSRIRAVPHVLLVYCSNLLIEMCIMTDTCWIFSLFHIVMAKYYVFCIGVTVLCLDYISKINTSVHLPPIAVSLEIFLIFW